MEDYPQLAIPMNIPIHMGQMMINNKKSSMKFAKKKVIRFGLGKN
jgi:5,10-methylenetetrahydrofolate reductase